MKDILKQVAIEVLYQLTIKLYFLYYVKPLNFITIINFILAIITIKYTSTKN